MLHPEHYDGISEYRCNQCNYRQGRWTGKELYPGFVEPRLGEGGKPLPYNESEPPERIWEYEKGE